MRRVMNERGSGSPSGGIGFLGLLTIVFIVLKLVGHITWSWLWVLAPIWAIPGLILGGFAFFLGAAHLKDVRRSREIKKRSKKKEQERIASTKRANEEAERFSELIKGSVTPPNKKK